MYKETKEPTCPAKAYAGQQQDPKALNISVQGQPREPWRELPECGPSEKKLTKGTSL